MLVSLLDQATEDEVLPGEPRVFWVFRLIPPLLAVDQLHDVKLIDHEALILHNEQGSTAPAKVSVEPQLSQANVMHHPHFCVDVHLQQRGADQASSCFEVQVFSLDDSWEDGGLID